MLERLAPGRPGSAGSHRYSTRSSQPRASTLPRASASAPAASPRHLSKLRCALASSISASARAPPVGSSPISCFDNRGVLCRAPRPEGDTQPPRPRRFSCRPRSVVGVRRTASSANSEAAAGCSPGSCPPARPSSRASATCLSGPSAPSARCRAFSSSGSEATLGVARRSRRPLRGSVIDP